MSFADQAAATALRLISKYGRDVSFTRIVTPGSYNSASGTTSAPVTATQVVKAYAKDMTSYVGQPVNVQIKAGDKQLFVAASGFNVPNEGDTFSMDNYTYTIVPLSRGGLGILGTNISDATVLYTIHGRRE